MKKYYYLFASLFIVMLMSSCGSTKEIAYFQDVTVGQNERVVNASEIKIKPNDKISIVVNSKDPQLAALFNLPVLSYRIGEKAAGVTNSSNQVCSYTVDTNGNIDFPYLGSLHVAGLNRAQIASMVKQGLMTAEFGIKDPTVTVEYMNLNISVLGEVKSPGSYSVDRDEFTILDAISKAGDLTIYGRRDNVKVVRSNNGQRVVYEVNLCSAEDVYASPVFYLQQNDIVYVEPNTVRARQSTANGNNLISTSFWISVASVLTSIAVLIFK